MPGVVISSVLLRKAEGRSWLEAHVELERESTLTVAQTRAHLKLALPIYMIPSTYVRHPMLPVTDRGKIDRHALLSSEHMPW